MLAYQNPARIAYFHHTDISAYRTDSVSVVPDLGADAYRHANPLHLGPRYQYLVNLMQRYATASQGDGALDWFRYPVYECY
jgi:hypothetical protein